MNPTKKLSLCALLCVTSLLVSAPALHAQAFTVTAPASLTVYPGEGDVPLKVSVASSTYTGPVNITLSGMPSGISVSPAPLVLTPGTTGTITIHVGLHADQEAFPAAASTDSNVATNTVSVVGAVGSTTAKATFGLTVSLSNAAFAPSSSQLTIPVMKIDTGGTPITSLDDYVSGTVTITSPDGSTSYLPSSSLTDNTAGFHLHGNTTANMPKKPYKVKLNTSADLMTALGVNCGYVTSSGKPVCDKSKSYILLANYDDKSLLRDWSASALANSIPYGGDYLSETPLPASATGTIPTPSGDSRLLPWAPHSVFVDLYLNGVYEGNYQFIEEVKVDSHRINIPELTESDTSGDVSGGYQLEIDNHKDESFVFTTPPQGLPIGINDPDFSPDPNIPEQTSYISNYVDTAENALFSSNFTDPNTGWRAYYDEASAVNFYLVNDIMGNVDGGDFYSSDYLYKNLDNPFLYMGPVWDFDISSGNVNYEPIINPSVPWMQTEAIWYKRWFQDPGFKADVVKQFNTLKANGVFSNWIASITAQSKTLEPSQSANYLRWPMLGVRVWPNPVYFDTYDEEVSYLTNFLNLRIAYLDSILNAKAGTSLTLTAPSGTIYQYAQKTTRSQGLRRQVSLRPGLLPVRWRNFRHCHAEQFRYLRH